MKLCIERWCFISQTNIVKMMCQPWKHPMKPPTETGLRMYLGALAAMGWVFGRVAALSIYTDGAKLLSGTV